MEYRFKKSFRNRVPKESPLDKEIWTSFDAKEPELLELKRISSSYGLLDVLLITQKVEERVSFDSKGFITEKRFLKPSTVIPFSAVTHWTTSKKESLFERAASKVLTTLVTAAYKEKDLHK